MRILVTGGAGFIGSHTVDMLLNRQHEVHILDALLPPVHTDGTRPDYVPAGDVEFLHGDVRDRGAWERALQGAEAVFHFAAYQDYLLDFSTFFHTNAVSTALLYEVIVEKRLPIQKVVVASSQAVYGEGRYLCRGGRSSSGTSCAASIVPQRLLWSAPCFCSASAQRQGSGVLRGRSAAP